MEAGRWLSRWRKENTGAALVDKKLHRVARIVGQVQLASDRDSQSKCWVKPHDWASL
jgi:hypothetical protein